MIKFNDSQKSRLMQIFAENSRFGFELIKQRLAHDVYSPEWAEISKRIDHLDRIAKAILAESKR